MITTKMGKGKLPLFCGNGEREIPIYDSDGNKDNSAAATMVNINEDILLTDEISIFFLSTNAINIF